MDKQILLLTMMMHEFNALVTIKCHDLPSDVLFTIDAYSNNISATKKYQDQTLKLQIPKKYIHAQSKTI